MYLSIDRPRMVLNIHGRQPKARPRAEPGRLIEPSGLKVIHLLLTDPASPGLSYRALAPRAGVSFASVGIILRALVRTGHLATNRKRLLNPSSLIDHFLRGYGLKLRPELVIGTFRHRVKEFDAVSSRITDRLASAAGHWAWTGGVAGGALTRHLKTDHLTFFVDREGEKALQAEPLAPDPREGNVTLLRLFAPSALASPLATPTVPTATSLLVYAELLNDGRPRELETAALLRPLILPDGKTS